ncbi:hypothetical protein [Zoogloea sp.]|uniref:hypothetical protein n=1 Tax=Zoogloea sp. TaxID=49181 RepID=UPI0035B001EC
MREFGVRVGGVLLLVGAGFPALASEPSPLRVSIMLGEAERPGLLFESDELDPPELALTRGLSEASARIAAEMRGSDPIDLPLGKGIGSRISLGETLTYDSNLFRLSGAAAAKAAGLAGMGDWYSVTKLGLGLDKSYAGQQLVLEYELSMTRYGAFDFLNNNANTAVGRWRWSAGPDWKGELAAEHREAMDDFAYYRQQQRSLAVTRQVSAGGFYQLMPDWQVGVQAAQGSRRYPDGSRPSNEIDFTGLDTVLRYVPESGAVVAITRRRAQGQYPNAPITSTGLSESRFDQDELFAEANLPLRSGTRLLGRVGSVTRTYQRFPQNNYSGRNAMLGLDWQVTPRTTLGTTLRYDIEPAQDFVSNYVAVKGLRLGAVWAYSTKLRVESRLEWRDAQYRGDPGFGVSTGAQREDKSMLASVAGTWQLAPRTRWITALTRERRESSEAGLSFNYWTLAGSLQWVF